MVDATLPQERRDFYVYVIFRPDGTPCYVGKGRRDRWKAHVKRAKNRHLSAIYANADGNLPAVKIRENLIETDALATEIAVIAAIGRECRGGTLVNQTDGGDGTSGYNEPKSASHRAAISAALSGRKLTEEQRKSISAASKGRKLTEHHKNALLRANTGRKRGALSDVVKGKISAANTGRKMSVESRKLMSLAGAGRPKTEGHKAKIRQANLGRELTNETKNKMKDASRLRWTDAEKQKVRDFHSNMTPEQKAERSAKISRRTKVAMENPAIRDALRASALNRPDMHLNFRRRENG